ncbi:MAG: S8 family serine peptidase [FCB group bacterium]|nr:S8 family serine peptidase [FCB group bacterium]
MKRVLLLFALITPLLAFETPYAENQLIVRVADKADLIGLKADLQKQGLEFDKQLVRQLNIWLVTVDGKRFASTREALALVQANPKVVWAQLDHLVSQREIPDDPDFPNMWDMNNTGQNGGTPDADIDAPEAWDITTGGGTALGDDIVVAVVDGGVAYTHPDLADNIWTNTNEIAGNGIDDDGNGYVDDIHGWDAYANDGSIPQTSSHGTHVAGTVGARGNNGTDVTGVNWDVKIMCVAGSSGNTSTISIAYGYVLDQKTLWLETNGDYGANVVATNSSFGVDYADCESGSYPVWNDLYNAMGAVGILSAAATINANQNVDQIGDVPTGCSSDYLVTVTNTTRFDEKYGSAGYGALSIDLGAPGTQICSTVPGGVSCSKTGTSMATPHVAGAIGLLHAAVTADWAAYYLSSPGPAALELKQVILETVDSLPTLEGVTVSGGRLNLYNAVFAASTLGGTFQAGDINQDDVIDILDIMLIVGFITGTQTPTPQQAAAADFNNDGIINIVDIILILNLIIGG